MALKTVEEHNAEVKKARDKASWSGIICPSCQERELKWGAAMATVFPPKRQVECRCGWSGYVE